MQLLGVSLQLVLQARPNALGKAVLVVMVLAVMVEFATGTPAQHPRQYIEKYPPPSLESLGCEMLGFSLPFFFSSNPRRIQDSTNTVHSDKICITTHDQSNPRMAQESANTVNSMQTCPLSPKN